ncbi:MAG: hypothetical protein PVS3B3_33560 [Ktedonobacteraceae bacterium]
MHKIGPITHIQIQPASIKVGKPEHYDPTRLFVLDELLLSRSGVVGVVHDGQHIIDVHNANHPETKSRGDNGFSIGFTSHYESMRCRFGKHIVNACAGENIPIETDTIFSLANLHNGLAIQQTRTGEYIFLTDIQPIVPCLPFSIYAAKRRLAPSEVKETLQFLMHGRRGFLAELVDKSKTVSVHTGDILYRMP